MLWAGAAAVVFGVVDNLALAHVCRFAEMESAVDAVCSGSVVDALYLRIARGDHCSMDRYWLSSIRQYQSESEGLADEHGRTVCFVPATDPPRAAAPKVGASAELHVGRSVHLEFYRPVLVAGDSDGMVVVSDLPISRSHSAGKVAVNVAIRTHPDCGFAAADADSCGTGNR